MKLGRKTPAPPPPNEAGVSAPAPAPAKKMRAAKPAKPGRAKSGGRKSFTLLVGDEGAILVQMSGATLIKRLFAPSAQSDHTGPLIELLRANPKVPISILVDVLDQQYVRHTFPPVSSMSINGLVKRRMDRDFNPEDLKNALALGRDTEGKKEWQYLIIALANTPLMQQWIEFVVEQPNQISGVFLLPLEMQHVLPTINKAMGETRDLPWKFMMTHNKVSGYRVVVLRDGKLAFTRVSQASEEVVPAVIAGNIEQEIIGTIEYLRRLGFKDNDQLDLSVIAAQEVTQLLDLRRFGAGAAQALTPYDVAEALGLKQAALSADRFGDVVVTAAFAIARKPTLRFSNAYIDKLTTLYKSFWMVLGGGALIALVLLGISVSTAMDWLDTDQKLTDLAKQQQDTQSQIDHLQHAIAGLDKDVAYKSLVVATQNHFIKDVPTMDSFIAALAPVLTDAIRVKHIEWYLKQDDSAAASAPTNAASSTVGKPISVDFNLTSTSTDQEVLNKTANRFIATLKDAMKDYEVTEQPFTWIVQKKESSEIVLDNPTPAVDTSAQAPTENKFTVSFVYKKGVKGTASAPAGAAPVNAPGAPRGTP